MNKLGLWSRHNLTQWKWKTWTYMNYHQVWYPVPMKWVPPSSPSDLGEIDNIDTLSLWIALEPQGNSHGNSGVFRMFSLSNFRHQIGAKDLRQERVWDHIPHPTKVQQLNQAQHLRLKTSRWSPNAVWISRTRHQIPPFLLRAYRCRWTIHSMTCVGLCSVVRTYHWNAMLLFGVTKMEAFHSFSHCK